MQSKSFKITEENVDQYAKQIADWIGIQVKNANRSGIIFGMSGGIDCSVVARLCQLAEVDTHLVMMPYGDDMERTKSYQHAMEFVNKFNFPYHIYDIKQAVDALTSNRFSEDKANLELSQANLRPRVRMTYLYQLAQQSSRFVSGTSNMSERLVGYFTKWGDGACDISPIAMLTKQEVYTLARYLDIPDSIISKKPSAGLWENQTDEAELGMTYAQIDAYILNGTSGDTKIDKLIISRAKMSEHKFNPIPIFIG